MPLHAHHIKRILYFPLAIPALLAYTRMRGDNKRKLHMDIARFCAHLMATNVEGRYVNSFYCLMCSHPEFRSVFYMRVGPASWFFKFLLPPKTELSLATRSKNMGGGIYVQHGYSTVVDAASVGENL